MLVSPFKNVKQFTKVQILPHQMNSDIKNNMLLSLCKQVENKCNKVGYVEKVHHIEKYQEQVMRAENLSGASNYNVDYICTLCNPIEKTIIVVQALLINQEEIIGKNGPIYAFILKNSVDNNIWTVSENYFHKEKKESLKVNNFIKIEILEKRINTGDNHIKMMGKLLDFATEQEVNDYYYTADKPSKDDDEDKQINDEESNFII